MVENVVLDVCNFLRSKSILISSQNQWLRGCIACFRENFNDFSSNQLKQFVFDQWKLADLKDVCSPSLPNNCKTASKLILPGKYAVQINYAVNISESYFKQLQKIRRPDSQDNLSVDSEKDKTNQVSTDRTLKLEITDGIVTLLGFEDEPVGKLADPLVSGVKAVLNGPIECRKGVLFLKNENVTILGGEVDSLHVTNAAENILARALGQPENAEPYKGLICHEENNDQFKDDTDIFLQVSDDIENAYRGVEKSGCGSLLSSSRISKSANDTSKDDHHLKSSEHTASDSLTCKSKAKNWCRTPHTTVDEFTDNLSPCDAVTIKSLQSVQSSIASKSFNPSVLELDGDDDYFALMPTEQPEPARHSSKQTSINSYFNTKGPSKSKTGSSSNSNTVNRWTGDRKDSKAPYEIEDRNTSTGCSIDVGSNVDSTRESNSNRLPQIQSSAVANRQLSQTDALLSDGATLFNEYQVIENDLELSKHHRSPREISVFPPNKYPATHIVRASVESLSQKLSIQDSKWSLSAVVKIKSTEVEVDFSSRVLDEVFGMTAEELQAKRRHVSHDPDLKQKLNATLKLAQRTIQKLDCDMKIHFPSSITKPTVLEIIQ